MANKTEISNFDESLEDLPLSLQKSIKDIVKEEGYARYRIENKIAPQTDNFTSFLYEVDITGETINGKKVTPLFIKESVTLDKIAISKISDLYCKELFIYNDLSRLCSSLQEDANVPDTERFTFVKQYQSDNDSLIVMENLSKKGFKTYNKSDVIPLEFVELSIIQLAKFHALSYVIKKKMPNYFEAKIKDIKSPITVDSDMEGFIHKICAVAGQVSNGDAKAKISNYGQRLIDTYCKYVRDSVPSKGCLCHGDYKFQNILVKEEGGVPSAVQPIDFQLSYYGNPINDFLFFIFTCIDPVIRRKHLSYLKDLYFENFAKFLSYFNIDVSSTYSRQEFESDYEERFELGLVCGLYLSAFTFAHVEEGFDVTKLALSELPIIPDEKFSEHVRGIVEDYIEWGYL